MNKEMMKALEADGEKLRQLTGEEHGPVFLHNDATSEPEPQPEPCRDCNGEGSFEVPEPQRDDPYYCVVVECENCKGAGWV